MATPKVYVICDQNCKFESMTKEQILSAIMQAVNEGTIGNIDAGFVQTIKTINGLPLRFFVGEQSAYDALSEEDKKDLFAIITNDTTPSEIYKVISDLQTNCTELTNGLNDGTFKVKNAENADKASKDASGNVIDRTYGNFARDFESSALFNYKLTLSGHGTFLFTVSIVDSWGTFTATTMAHFKGIKTFSMLNLETRSTGIVAYRLKITADGVASVQRSSKTDGAFIEYADVETNITSGYSVSIKAQKIF